MDRIRNHINLVYVYEDTYYLRIEERLFFFNGMDIISAAFLLSLAIFFRGVLF